MARFVYLVTSHTNPHQVARLARAILRTSQNGQVVIHHDPKGPPFVGNTLDGDPRIHFVPGPIKVNWGDFSQVRGFLHASGWVMNSLPFDWLVWISGQDYPLGPLDAFEHRIEMEGYDAYYRYFEATDPSQWPPREGESRYFYQYYALPRSPYYYRLPGWLKRALGWLRSWTNKHQPFIFMRPGHRGNPARVGIRAWVHPFRKGITCYGGWSWLNLNSRAVHAMHHFVDSHPDFVRYYQRTICPDESFVQTILTNDTSLRICNDPLRFVYWGERPHPSSPEVIRTQVLGVALASGAPFGRKFDERVDVRVLDQLDAHAQGPPNAAN